MAYYCENRRYKTNAAKGHPHGPGNPGGSALPGPLSGALNGVDYTLWLEHVIEIATSDEVYWFMWYDPSGNPTIKVSGVLNRNDIRNMAQQLIEVP